MSTAALNCTLLATKVTHCFADVFNQGGSPILSDSDLFFFFLILAVKQPMFPAVEVGGVLTPELTGNSHKVNFFRVAVYSIMSSPSAIIFLSAL